MAGFEDLIRKALAQQSATDPAARQKIYTSSRQALERMLGQNPTMSEAQVTTQRQRLEGAINAIEAEYGPAQAAAAPKPPRATTTAPTPPTPPAAPTVAPSGASVGVSGGASVAPQPVSAPAPKPMAAPQPTPKPAAAAQAGPKPAQPTTKPVGAPPPMPRLREEPVLAEPIPGPVPEPIIGKPADSVRLDMGDRVAPLAPERPLEDYTAEYCDELTTQRKPYAKLFLWTIIVVGIGVALWWAITFGPALLRQQLDGSVPNPATTIESGSFVPGGGDGWLNVFLPAEDSQNVDTEGRGTADLFQDANTTFLRMASNAGSTANTIRIKMPRGIMQNIRGKVATFELTMKGPEEDGHQFAIFCEFGPMGECGRKRFRIRQKVEAFVFDVLVNDAALPSTQDAYLVINTDLSSVGKSVDLLAIRVRTGD
ncbi:MAG: hypothetical protein AAF903_13135 [Pseudomonadota bacterium]